MAFVVTLVPFFHGALRHLDESYLIDPMARTIKRRALATDFVFLFGESCLLFALAHRMDRVDSFLALFALLLLVDIAWAVAFDLATPAPRLRALGVWGLLRLATPSLRRKTKERAPLFQDDELISQLKWAANNVAFLLVIGCWVAILGLVPGIGPHFERVTVMVIAVARTASDYRISWDFYFPPASKNAL